MTVSRWNDVPLDAMHRISYFLKREDLCRLRLASRYSYIAFTEPFFLRFTPLIQRTVLLQRTNTLMAIRHINLRSVVHCPSLFQNKLALIYRISQSLQICLPQSILSQTAIALFDRPLSSGVDISILMDLHDSQEIQRVVNHMLDRVLALTDLSESFGTGFEEIELLKRFGVALKFLREQTNPALDNLLDDLISEALESENIQKSGVSLFVSSFSSRCIIREEEVEVFLDRSLTSTPTFAFHLMFLVFDRVPYPRSRLPSFESLISQDFEHSPLIKLMYKAVLGFTPEYVTNMISRIIEQVNRLIITPQYNEEGGHEYETLFCALTALFVYANPSERREIVTKHIEYNSFNETTCYFPEYYKPDLFESLPEDILRTHFSMYLRVQRTIYYPLYDLVTTCRQTLSSEQVVLLFVKIKENSTYHRNENIQKLMSVLQKYICEEDYIKHYKGQFSNISDVAVFLPRLSSEEVTENFTKFHLELVGRELQTNFGDIIASRLSFQNVKTVLFPHLTNADPEKNKVELYWWINRSLPQFNFSASDMKKLISAMIEMMGGIPPKMLSQYINDHQHLQLTGRVIEVYFDKVTPANPELLKYFLSDFPAFIYRALDILALNKVVFYFEKIESFINAKELAECYLALAQASPRSFFVATQSHLLVEEEPVNRITYYLSKLERNYNFLINLLELGKITPVDLPDNVYQTIKDEFSVLKSLPQF